jgi:hypothetical protein
MLSSIPPAVIDRNTAFSHGTGLDAWDQAEALAASFDRVHAAYDLLREDLGWAEGDPHGPGRGWFRYVDPGAVAAQPETDPALRLLRAVRAGAAPGLYSLDEAHQHSKEARARRVAAAGRAARA